MKNLSVKNEYFIKVSLLLIIFLFIFVEFILALTPPIARDALIHHLAIPKLWIMHGGFYEIPWAVYSYYPMNLDLLYLVPLYFGNDIIPHFIHMGFGIGTAVIIYYYLKGRLNHIAGLSGALIFISTPIIIRLSTMAYVDLGLVFFITASILAFLRWRESEYRHHKWFLISSVAMGLALGTKYNALVAWFFFTLALVFIYSRDSGNQWKAVMYGLIFFVISLIVFSPWLIKNIILTGNPLYPLFAGIFNSNAGGESGTYSIASGYSHLSMFKIREMLYGENLWEILLIPARIFFQGQDNSARYFDGVLNPILIIFVPFAFIKKDMKTEKMFFLVFSVFFILITFFLDEIRIRYILPVIPFLVILTVMGLVNIFAWLTERESLLLRICTSGLVFFLIALLSMNIIYIKKYYIKIDPVNYLLKKESRDNFIGRHDSSYPAMMYINKNTARDSRIRLILLAGRGYYLDRIYQEDPSLGIDIIRGMIDHSGNDRTFRNYLNSLGCSHIFMRYDLFRQFLDDNYSPATVNQISQRMGKFLEIVYNTNGYAVFKVKTGYSSQ
jgi:4-amino-4-deoxy-L-arabinose transferase-like glycosyltransferase